MEKKIWGDILVEGREVKTREEYPNIEVFQARRKPRGGMR